MDWNFCFTMSVLAAVIVGLIRYAHLADVIFMSALALLTLAGVITPAEAVAGFHNEGVLTIAALFVVAAALVETGFLESVARRILGNASDATGAVRRFVPATVFASAFLNNTTIVAMGMPALVEWARKRNVPAARLLLPLSYAAILGGVCTLIGTSTNLVVHGLMKQSGLPGLQEGIGMWELSRVGVPIAIVGGIYLVFAARMLPERTEFREQLGATRREFLCEVAVESGCPLIGRTVQDAGLRGLPGLFLIEIERGADIVAPVRPDERLRVGDRLVFTGVVSTIVDLKRIPGLRTDTDLTYEIGDRQQSARRLCEAVISVSSPLVGRGVREANFRSLYDSVVVAIHRNGHRVERKIGDIFLEPGDTLLLETGPGFVASHRNNPDFYLVSEAGEAEQPARHRAWIAMAIAAALVLSLSMSELARWFGLPASAARWCESRRAIFAVIAAGLMVVTRCVPATRARRSIDLSVLLTIAAALGVGTAIDRSGVAAWLARMTIDVVRSAGPTGALAAVYGMTWLLSEFMSNNAAAALMFPIAVAAAQLSGSNPRAFAVAVTVAASSAFIFPAGYQTHLMVFGPGGYRVSDFVRLGIPMVVLWFILSLVLIPYGWNVAR